ncbi:MAG: LCP family protein [Lachnospiraceae bacterium]|nr:LCP family protein [Lachnospiraceae bacterium]
MDDKNRNNAIGENESIQEGLEQFLENELQDPGVKKKTASTGSKPPMKQTPAKQAPVKKAPVKKAPAKQVTSEKEPLPRKKTEEQIKKRRPQEAPKRKVKRPEKPTFDEGFGDGFEKGYAAGFNQGYEARRGYDPGYDEDGYADAYDDEEAYDGYDAYEPGDAYEEYDTYEEPDAYEEYEDYEPELPRGGVKKAASPRRQSAPVGRDRRHEEPARREKDKRERAAAEKRIKAARAARVKTQEKREKERLKKEKDALKKERSGGDGKKKHGFIKFLIALAVLLCLLYFLMNRLVGSAYKQMTTEQPAELAGEPMKEEGVSHILLIGNDSRENGEDGRSDAMILVSMNPKTKKIYMTSFLRDMYVTIPGHGENRLNAAYAYGGAALLCQTIKENFDIEVNRYAIVNFQAFAALVDAVGGVDLELSSEEVEWVNAYLNEYNMLEGRDMQTDYLDTSKSGMLHLNGPQALAYSRNRYIGTDFGRTERQRKVLAAIKKKMPVAMATNASGLMEGIFPYLTTNLKQSEVTELSLKAAAAATYETTELTVPADGTWSNADIGGKAVLQVDFDANKKILKDEIFGEEKTSDQGEVIGQE